MSVVSRFIGVFILAFATLSSAQSAPNVAAVLPVGSYATELQPTKVNLLFRSKRVRSTAMKAGAVAAVGATKGAKAVAKALKARLEARKLLSQTLRANPHVNARHIAKTKDYLQSRKIARASTFVNVSHANRFTGLAIQRSRPQVDAWLRSSGSKRLVISERFDNKTGKIFERQSNALGNARSVKVVLEKDGSRPEGYRIITAYPD